jgi:hypothetical protein
MTLRKHVRIDEEIAKLLREVAISLGWSESQVVREAITLLGSSIGHRKARRIIGQGRFQSGICDLGSNKKHLADFGE